MLEEQTIIRFLHSKKILPDTHRLSSWLANVGMTLSVMNDTVEMIQSPTTNYGHLYFG